MLTNQDRLILDRFKEYSQEIEENFAQMLALNPKLRLKFENLNEAYTDGHKIVVDPGMFDIFADNSIRKKALSLLNWPEDTVLTKEDVIYVICHAQVIHECLHALYSEFPLPAINDPLADTNNKKIVLSTISNIIEDSYIEAIGATKYTNIRFFLQFFRTCISIVNNKKKQATKVQINNKSKLLSSFINYFISYKLYPMDINPTPSLEIQDYIRKAKPLFNMATMSGDSKVRYRYVQEIFHLIEPLIPDDKETIDQNNFDKQMPGANTHEINHTTPKVRIGKNLTPISSLFPQISKTSDTNEEYDYQIDANDPNISKFGYNIFDSLCISYTSPTSEEQFKEQMKEETQKVDYMDELMTFTENIDEAENKQLQAMKEEIEGHLPQSIRINGDEFKDFNAHKNISIIENHPIPNKKLKARYNEIYEELKSNIEYYNGCFLQMLQANRTVKDDGYKYGLGISSKKLGDIKNRYWYRNVTEDDSPDLAVLILIDGSGSMSGEKRINATKAAIILHEVLKKQGINHSIAEHRAYCNCDSMEVNLLIDFNSKQDQKFNILRIQAIDVNRDGLSLLWAERYISKQHNENKLIIVVSDGQPNHGSYTGNIAKKDTHNIVMKIEKNNIGVIGIALEENERSACYNDLKDIYPNLINCSTPQQLTRKLLEVIKKVI